MFGMAAVALEVEREADIANITTGRIKIAVCICRIEEWENQSGEEDEVMCCDHDWIMWFTNTKQQPHHTPSNYIPNYFTLILVEVNESMEILICIYVIVFVFNFI